MAKVTATSVPKLEKIQDAKQFPEMDRYRFFIFPNNIRKFRKARGLDSLLQLSQQISSTTYIRLSKIERGEIFARPDELRSIADTLKVDVEDLLLDIDDPIFDIAAWAEDYMSANGADDEADNQAILLAAAMRARRARDEALTIAVLEQDYGIAPVILSRIENAFKSLDRWSPAIQQSLFRLFDVADAAALVAHVAALHAGGQLDAHLPLIANPAERIAKTRAKTRKLRAELASPDPHLRRRRDRLRSADMTLPATATTPSGGQSPAAMAAPPALTPVATRRMVPLYGAPLPDGLIAPLDTGEQIEVNHAAGPRTYALRICRPTLGPGMPGRAIAIVDPDRFPSAGSLAVVREPKGLRLLAVMADRQGQMIGFSEHPNYEVALDALNPQDVATVLSAMLE